MASIQTHRVPDEPGGSGPYAYRVEHVGNNEQEWEYLGPVGKVDPEDLTSGEIAELRDEGFALARFRENETADFVHLDLANTIRDELVSEFGESVLAATDDRRETDVQLAEDAPPDAVRRATGHAEDDQAAANQGAGQAPLTEEERSRIDFTETDVPTAMTAKAAILDEGVDDWLSVWSEDLSTVGEARGAAERNRESIRGDRLDNDDEQGVEMTFSEATSEQEKQAREYVVEQGDEGAMDALVNQFGYEPGEVEALAEMDPAEAPV